MKQQLVVIHGGSVFDGYEEYLEALKNREVSLDRLIRKDWKSTLGTNLGDGYQVVSLTMPNSQNAKYLEWKIWFEKLIPLFDKDVIFLGHSLGGIFLVKYLSEETYHKTIKATFLIAPPSIATTQETLADFGLGEDLSKFGNGGGSIFVYHSKDDAVVPFVHMDIYRKKLSTATFRVFEDRGHFKQEDFPELVNDIQELNN
jgi:predicted alpha/beta hydrolase family esterase